MLLRIYQSGSLFECIYNDAYVYLYFADICEPGWNYFNGFCYFTSKTCQNWTTALDKCRQENSVLVDVQNNEENVFLQHLHNAAKSWLGLNDIFTEGSFSWVDRGAGNFTAWAKNQPNNFRDEDCVHALGVEYKYEWNDVKCGDCHQFTCKKGEKKPSLCWRRTLPLNFYLLMRLTWRSHSFRGKGYVFSSFILRP